MDRSRTLGMTTSCEWVWGDVVAETVGAATRLHHVPADAELWVREGRLLRGEGYASAPASARRELSRVGAILRLRMRGRYYLHASGAVSPEGEAWLLAGDTGAGKSTLAYALSRSGWSVLGDDGVIISLDAGRAVAHPWHDPLRVSSALTPVFPDLARITQRPAASDTRRRVPAPARRGRSAPIAGIAFVERGSGDAIVRIDEQAALISMIRQSPWVMIPDVFAGRHLRTFNWIAASVPVFRFMHTERQLHDVAATLGAAA
jgi:hypothetical protein